MSGSRAVTTPAQAPIAPAAAAALPIAVERRRVQRRIADRRSAVAGRRVVAAQRDHIADLRDEAADRREDDAVRRDDDANLRQEAADLREQLADMHEVLVKANSELDVVNATQMREANEKLVVAAVNAQTKAEESDHTAAQMSYLAEHDSLTGLPNRALLADRLQQLIAQGQRGNGKKFALLYLDLDRFKEINDTLGHAAGDQLLQSTAKRLLACVRNSDTVSRHGGDEFAVLLPDLEAANDATLTAQKLLKAMLEPHLIDGHRLEISLSIGISLFPDDGRDVESIIRSADTAMYHAKRAGRNGYRRFSAEMNSRRSERPSA
jgi:diguanylate cyclase (GGDEF)-like protein